MFFTGHPICPVCKSEMIERRDVMIFSRNRIQQHNSISPEFNFIWVCDNPLCSVFINGSNKISMDSGKLLSCRFAIIPETGMHRICISNK